MRPPRRERASTCEYEPQGACVLCVCVRVCVCVGTLFGLVSREANKKHNDLVSLYILRQPRIPGRKSLPGTTSLLSRTVGSLIQFVDILEFADDSFCGGAKWKRAPWWRSVALYMFRVLCNCPVLRFFQGISSMVLMFGTTALPKVVLWWIGFCVKAQFTRAAVTTSTWC